MKYLSSIIALSLGTVALQAHAQDAAAPPPDDAATAASPADAAAPSSAASPAGASAAVATQVSDAEVDQFAQATVKVQKIVADASIDQTAKQQQMAAAVTGTGLQPARYNEIAKAVPGDTALRTRVQTAMAKYAKPPQG
jgi:hypothetical protein